jgi:hypothetical protein
MPEYGNVPPEDVQVISNGARLAADVLGHVPAAMPDPWRQLTYEAVLGAILRDWVTNGTSELDDGDAEDLVNIVRVAYDVANDQDFALRDTAYRAILQNALEDWVQNWNAED